MSKSLKSTLEFFDNYAIWIIIALLSVHFVISTVSYRIVAPTWDESVYIGMGKYIFSAGQVGIWEVIRPIVLPILLGISWFLKINPIHSGRIIIALSLLLTLYFGYKLLEGRIDKKIALVFLSIMFLVPVVAYHDTWILAHFPAAMFGVLSLYFYKKESPLLAGVFAALSFLSRFTFGIFVFSFGLVLLIESLRRKESVRTKFRSIVGFSLGVVFALIPFLIFNYFMYADTVGIVESLMKPVLQASEANANAFYAVDGFLENALFYINVMWKNGAVFLLALLSVPFAFRKNTPTEIKVAILAFSIFLLYYTYIINKQERFFTDFIALSAIASAYVVDKILNKLDTRQILTYGAIFVIIFLVALSSMKTISTFDTPEGPRIYYHNYFSNVSGKKIITLHPDFVSYSNNLFIPIYDWQRLKIYNDNKETADYFAYHKQSFFCDIDPDPNCKEDVDKIERDLESRASIESNIDVNGMNFTIYKMKK